MMPLLPLDLEREVFETAAIRDRAGIPILLRVCRRVHSWIEPLLYRVILITDFYPDSDSPEFAALCATSATFKKRAVRHLFLEYPPHDDELRTAAQNFLCQLPAIESLVLDGDLCTDVLEIMDKMRLQKLNIRVPSFSLSSWARSTLSRPLFHSVIHLELYRDQDHIPTCWDDWTALASLSVLTHLCLDDKLAAQIVKPTLGNCKQLEVVIWALWDGTRNAVYDAQNLSVTDCRLVVMDMPIFEDDWEEGARFGKDFWVRADAFLAKKRSGEIDKSHFFLEK
ncbi:hypothetical protein R3P38DRAFT_2704579 [Favolaschia claudopus]|uniref:F-box domain-containing protein n=1 Tax=Favolaschia claudopus TaxID=2862362 RepID=A0AAW0BRL4_9AGAR